MTDIKRKLAKMKKELRRTALTAAIAGATVLPTMGQSKQEEPQTTNKEKIEVVTQPKQDRLTPVPYDEITFEVIVIDSAQKLKQHNPRKYTYDDTEKKLSYCIFDEDFVASKKFANLQKKDEYKNVLAAVWVRDSEELRRTMYKLMCRDFFGQPDKHINFPSAEDPKIVGERVQAREAVTEAWKALNKDSKGNYIMTTDENGNKTSIPADKKTARKQKKLESDKKRLDVAQKWLRMTTPRDY